VLDVRAIRPEALAQLLARDQFPGPFQKCGQEEKGLLLDRDPLSLAE
jgi:hypothetical protein